MRDFTCRAIFPLVLTFLVQLGSTSYAEYTSFANTVIESQRAKCDSALREFEKWTEVREAYYYEPESKARVILKGGRLVRPEQIIKTFQKHNCECNELSVGAYGRIISVNGILKLRLSGFKNENEIRIIKSPSQSKLPDEKNYLQVSGIVRVSLQETTIEVKDWDEISDLQSAAWLGDVFQVRERIQKGEDVNSFGYDGRTALIQARNKEVAQALIQAGARLDAKNYANHTALMRAASRDNLDVVEVLIAAGANVNLRDEDGCTALMIAASLGHAEIVQMLIDAGSKVNLKNELGVSALEFAAWNGYGDVAEKLRRAGAKGYTKEIKLLLAVNNLDFNHVWDLIRAGANPGIKDSNNTTVLMLAARRGMRFLETLINRTPDLNEKNDRGYTALICAIDADNSMAVKSLLEAGADPNLPGIGGSTPLEKAVWNQSPYIVQMLLEAGASTDRSNDRCRSPIENAVEKGDKDLVRILKEHGAKEPGPLEKSLLVASRTCSAADVKELVVKKVDMEFRDNQCRTPLILAADAGCTEVARILVEAGANRNAIFPYGSDGGFQIEDTHAVTVSGINLIDIYSSGGSYMTALDVAIQENRQETSDFLASVGGIRKDQESSPLIDAIKASQISAVDELLKKGVDVNARDRSKWTPLMYACQIGNLEMVRNLISSGADVNASYRFGLRYVSPIMLAAEDNHFEIVDLLLENRANEKYLQRSMLVGRIKAGDVNAVAKILNNGVPPDVQSTNSNPVIAIAANLGHWNIVRLLMKEGANINCPGSDGKTAMQIAKENDIILEESLPK